MLKNTDGMDETKLVSARASCYAVNAEENRLWQVLAQDWHPEHCPDGWVNLGVAENVVKI